MPTGFKGTNIQCLSMSFAKLPQLPNPYIFDLLLDAVDVARMDVSGSLRRSCGFAMDGISVWGEVGMGGSIGRGECCHG